MPVPYRPLIPSSSRLLQTGDVLTVDTSGTTHGTEIYTASSGTWTSAGQTPVELIDANVNRLAWWQTRGAPLQPGTVVSLEGTVERHTRFAAVFNFRDLGGYPAAGGRTVRWGRLYRSDGLWRLTPDDLEVFARVGVRTVLDLRRPT